MRKRTMQVKGIPAVVWGEKRQRVFIAVHGNMSHKEDAVIQLLAEKALKKGYQVISFDLPRHGERKEESRPCKVQFCVKDLETVMGYAKEKWEEISLFACSIGAYFSLLAYREDVIKQCLFLSPVIDMERIISNMMKWFDITPAVLQERQEIATPIGEVLYWDYYTYVKEHPVNKWETPSAILYGGKDNICELERVRCFADRFYCEMEIVPEGEHYFHTDSQLAAYRSWLDRYIQDKSYQADHITHLSGEVQR